MEMREFRWNSEKNELLKRTRGISFEEIIQCRRIDIIKNPNRLSQKFLLYEYENYVWVVPFVDTGEDRFLKTIFPSRKYTKIYLGGGQ